MFLNKAERDYLTSNRQFDNDYSYTIKSRLVKLHQFANQELPLLIKKGYLTEFCKLTENCRVSNALVVAQRAERGFACEKNPENEALEGTRTPDLRSSSRSSMIIKTAGLRNLRSAG
jgi:hypothetical protein